MPTLFSSSILDSCVEAFSELSTIPLSERVELLNEIRRELRKYSPFSEEPVDCIQWIPVEDVEANDYNPNSVAPPEMRLLEHSIQEDGYTQPVVAWPRGDKYEVVDGFHRNRVARESRIVSKRIMGYLPLAIIKSDRRDRNDRIAATIRHNRARGKHQVDAMSDIVVELRRRNWNEEKIGRELGMEPDEVLRLCQISGLAEMFKDSEFSLSWDIDSPAETDEHVVLEDIDEADISHVG